MYYGWPYTTDVPKFLTYPALGKPRPSSYDMLVSGHALFDRTVMDRLIPGAQYVSILREPVSQFLSAYAYWNFEKRFSKPGEGEVSVETFLSNVEFYRPRVTWQEFVLLENSMSFDLGFEKYSESCLRSNLPGLDDASSGIAMVLITEHLDESLLVLKHKMCWTLEDVVPFSLKVSIKRPPRLSSSALATLSTMNGKDQMLYAHFNQSLWQDVASIPNFEDELLQLRRLKNETRNTCMSYAYNDRNNRFNVLSYSRAWRESQCGRFMMDSFEFSKVFKYNQGLPVSECFSYDAKNVVLVAPGYESPQSSIFAKILYAHSIVSGKTVGLPTYDDSTNGTRLISSYALHSTSKNPRHAAIVAEGQPDLARLTLTPLTDNPHYRYVVILPDPVENFLRGWVSLNMSARLLAAGFNCTIGEAVTSKSPQVHEILSPLKNSLAAQLGQPSAREHFRTPIAIHRQLRTIVFTLVIPSTQLLEGLVFLSRRLCWELYDFAFIPPPPESLPVVDSMTRNFILAYNQNDAELWSFEQEYFNTTIGIEYRLTEDVARLKQRIRDYEHGCNTDFNSKEALLKCAGVPRRAAQHQCCRAKLQLHDYHDLFARRPYKGDIPLAHVPEPPEEKKRAQMQAKRGS
jgi:hypothetical protein